MLHKNLRLESTTLLVEEEASLEIKEPPRSTAHILTVFKEKDLVFGLGSSYRKKIQEELLRRGYPYVYSNQLNYPAVNLVVSNSNDTRQLGQHQKIYHLFLTFHRDYLLRPNGRPIPFMVDEPIMGAAYRRACKLLVRSAHSSSKVHFELSDIDFAKVCNKDRNDLGVTSSELRAAYRQAKEKGDNPHLLFYKYGEPCPPPWKQPPLKMHWQIYDELRAKKKAAQPDKANVVAPQAPLKQLTAG